MPEHSLYQNLVARQHLLEARIEGRVESRREAALSAFQRARLTSVRLVKTFGMIQLEVLGAVQRHNRHRNDVGGEESNHHRQRHGREEKLAHTRQQRHREEDDGRGKRGSKHRQRHLSSSILRGDHRWFSNFQMPVDIFQHHHGVIDEPRKRQRQSAQDHAVHGRPIPLQHHKRRQHGKRNGEENRQRSAQAAQEDKDHQAGEKQPDAAFMKQGLNCGADKARLVKDHGRPHLRRHVDQVVQGIANTRDDGDGVGVSSLLQHRQIDRALPVHMYYVVLQCVRVFQHADV